MNTWIVAFLFLTVSHSNNTKKFFKEVWLKIQTIILNPAVKQNETNAHPKCRTLSHRLNNPKHCAGEHLWFFPLPCIPAPCTVTKSNLYYIVALRVLHEKQTQNLSKPYQTWHRWKRTISTQQTQPANGIKKNSIKRSYLQVITKKKAIIAAKKSCFESNDALGFLAFTYLAIAQLVARLVTFL